MVMKVRLIGSKDCEKCAEAQKVYKKQNLEFEFYDADLDTHQKKLDEWKVDDMPVVQIFNDNKIIHQFFPGLVSVRAIRFKLNQLQLKRTL